MISFSTFYQMAAGSHKGRYELDNNEQLVFGKNLAVERTEPRIHALLLRAILEDPVASAHPSVEEVRGNISFMKDMGSPVDAQDVREWQRTLQLDISFGHECVADIPVSKNPSGSLDGGNEHLVAGLEAVNNNDTVVGSRNAKEAARYFVNKLEGAHASFSAYFATVGPEERERNDLLVALSGRLIAGCRLSRPSAELAKDYEELMSILAKCKKEAAGLPSAHLGLASEAIDVYLADVDGLLAKKRLVLTARAGTGLKKAGNLRLNSHLNYSHLRNCLESQRGERETQEPNVLYRGLTHVGEDEGGYFNLSLAPQRRGVIGGLKRFFNWVIRRDLRDKNQVTKQLRELCLKSERFDKDFVEGFWRERGNVPAGRRQWTLQDVDDAVSKLEREARTSQKIVKEVDGSAERRAFPLQKSPGSSGFSISELLLQGNDREGEIVVENGNEISAECSLYTIGDTTLLLADADLQEIDRRVQDFLKEKQAAGGNHGRTLGQREFERTPGQQLHKLRVLYGADVLKICHSYALEKLYNRWFFDDEAIRFLLSEKATDGRVTNDKPMVQLPGSMEISLLEEPYYGELVRTLRERLSESGTKVWDVMEKTPPPYELSKIFGDKIGEITPHEEWQSAVTEAMSRVKRMAFVRHAIENPVVNKSVQADERIEQYRTMLPERVGSDLATMLEKSEFTEAMNTLYNVAKPLSARMSSLTYLQRTANALACQNNEVPGAGQRKWQWQDYLSVFKEAWQLSEAIEGDGLAEKLGAMNDVQLEEALKTMDLARHADSKEEGVKKLALDPASLENDLAALKEFLRLPEEFTGKVHEGNRLLFESFVEAGDVLLSAHYKAGDLFQNVPAKAGDARIRQLKGVAAFYAEYSGYRVSETNNEEPGLQLFRNFPEDLERREPIGNLFGMEGDRVRLYGSGPEALAWESMDDLLSREARTSVVYFLENGLGGKVEADEAAIDRQVQLLKSFITEKGLKNESYTQQDIQQQLRKQMGAAPGKTTPTPPVPVPVPSLEEFEQKYYSPALRHLKKTAYKGSEALGPHPSDQEMKLCLSRVLPLAVASYDRDVERFGAERDASDRDDRIRERVADVIRGRRDLENARTDL